MEFALMNKDRQLGVIQAESSRIDLVSGSLPAYITEPRMFLWDRFGPGKSGDSYVKSGHIVGGLGMERLRQASGIRTNTEHLRRTHAISMMDTFWVKELGDTTAWAQVNPWKNPLPQWTERAILAPWDTQPSTKRLNCVSPDFSAQDWYTRATWDKQADGVYKRETAGYDGSGYNSIIPIYMCYASQVAEAFIPDKRFARCKLRHRTDKGPYKNSFNTPIAVSKAFTSERIGYIEYKYIEPDSNERQDIKVVDVERLTSGNIPGRSGVPRLTDMLVLDALVLNRQRGQGDFGYLVDNDTQKIIGPAPIIVPQQCFCFSAPVSYREMEASFEKHYREASIITPFRSRWNEQVHWVMTSELEKRLENMYPFQFKKLGGPCDVSKEHLEFMEYIVNRQIRELTRIGTHPGEHRVCR